MGPLSYNVRFELCYFRFPINGKPLESQKTLLLTLLSSDAVRIAFGPPPPNRQRQMTLGGKKQEP